MKQKIVIHDQITGDTVSTEFNVRNKEQFKATLKYHSSVQLPKKGKGSYKRKPKHVKSVDGD